MNCFYEKAKKAGRYVPINMMLGLALLAVIAGCKDSGSVGDTIGQPEANLTVDTMQISGVRLKKLNGFSGGLRYLSAGQFDDPLFGHLRAVGYLKPRLAANADSVSFDKNSTLHLKLAIHQQTAYGDTLKDQQFVIKKVGELFRSQSARLHNVLRLKQGTTVGSFSVSASDDTLDIPLARSWARKYGQFFNRTDSTRDSAYVHRVNGLAIVPQNTAKIVAFDPVTSRFIVDHLNTMGDTTKTDSLSVSPRDYAFSLSRSAVASHEGSAAIFNTLEQVLTFNFNLSSDNIDPINVSRAEIVIKRDNLLLNQLGANTVRPDEGTLSLHYISGDELPQSLKLESTSLQPGALSPQPGQVPPLVTASYQKSDGSYHFNITPLIRGRFFEGTDSTQSFYITTGASSGVIHSNILFNRQSGDNGPKLIITSVKSS